MKSNWPGQVFWAPGSILHFSFTSVQTISKFSNVRQHDQGCWVFCVTAGISDVYLVSLGKSDAISHGFVLRNLGGKWKSRQVCQGSLYHARACCSTWGWDSDSVQLKMETSQNQMSVVGVKGKLSLLCDIWVKSPRSQRLEWRVNGRKLLPHVCWAFLSWGRVNGKEVERRPKAPCQTVPQASASWSSPRRHWLQTGWDVLPCLWF